MNPQGRSAMIARRVLQVGKGIAFVGALLLLRAYAQEPAGKQVAQAKKEMMKKAVPGQPATEPAKEEMTDALSMPTDRKAEKSIQAAQDLIKEESWGQAASILQKLLESKEDIFVEVERRTKGPDGKEQVTRQRTSLRVEANRLLGTMPAKGLEFYELQNGARARADLTQAKQAGDRQLLALVSQRYFHTAAGAEATNLLGTYRLDRGDYRMAALYFERLLSHHLADKLSSMTLFKAALAFRGTGDQPKADAIWKQLTKKNPKGLTIGDQEVSLDRLQKEMDQFRVASSTANTFDWPTYGGGPNRSAQGNGGAPFLEVKWTQDMHWWGQGNHSLDSQRLVTDVLKSFEDRQLPILPAFYPIAATIQKDGQALPLVIYRSFYGIHAVNALNGKLHWETPSQLSIDMVVKDPQKAGNMGQWIQTYGGNNSNPLLENSTLGSLSTDNVYVYVVEDLAVPPHPSHAMQMQMNGMRGGFGHLDKEVRHNRLQAFELDSGKIKWELGGPSSDSQGGDKGELNDSYFLSAPLPLGDRLYVLNEKNGELRLVCLDPSKDAGQGENPIAWTQTLATVRDKLDMDAGRRIQAALPAYGEGILVCPTNAGAVLAIDLLTHSLVWAHSYRKVPATDPNQAMGMGGGMMIQRRMIMRGGMVVQETQPQGGASEWKVTAPIIQDGKVVYTPPDGPALLCLNLRDGTPAWEAARADDLYLGGVFKDKVLLVGKSYCRGLNLADGKEVWKQKTGMPSGQGTASDNVYYLPLRQSAQPKDPGPEVCAIDIETGKIVKEARSRKKSNGSIEVPGNLLFYHGDVISQTALAVASYPQLKVKLAQIDERLKTNPNDSIGLTERGELRLDGKDLQGAVADLRTALASQPSPNASPEERKKLSEVVPRTRAKLFDAFAELFQQDFNSGEKYLAEFNELCKVPAPSDASAQDALQAQEEEQRRRASFLCLLGDGREKQGRLLEAFQAYQEFGGLKGSRELISVPGHADLRTRPDVWAQGRIAAMVAKANPDQRKPLEEKIAEEWRAVQNSSDLEKLRQFVRVFGSLFSVGKEARLRLAERLIEENAFLEAELNLLQLRQQDDTVLAARAVEDLARLMIRKGLLEDAAYYFRILGRDYSATVIRDGKTGADLFNEQATDKRFLPYLDELSGPWSGGKVQAKEVFGTFNANLSTISFDDEIDSLPFFQRYRLALSMNPGSTSLQLKLFDRAGDDSEKKEVWTQNISETSRLGNMFQGGPSNVHFPHQHLGHLVVLSLGPLVYGIDPIERKVLWDKNLHGPGLGSMGTMMPDANGRIGVYYAEGFFRKVGQAGPIEPAYVCLINRDTITAVDPTTGQPLWTKSDVSTHTEVFGDNQYLFLVDTGNGTAINGTGRALRAHDGDPVTVPDFAALYQRRIGIVGRNLLLSDSNPSSGLTLRLYDVLSGKDVWKKTFASNSLVLKSDDPYLVGAVEPGNEGKATVVDLRSRKEVLISHLLPQDIEKVQQIHVLADRDYFYLAINKQPNPQDNRFGGPYPDVTNGIRSIPVNGRIYAYHRNNGKLHYFVDVANQMLLTNQFQDMPILLFAVRNNNRMMGMGGMGGMGGRVVFNAGGMGGMAGGSVMSIEKRTGKLKFSPKEYNNNEGLFSALDVNPRNGTVELIRNNLKIVHSLDTDDQKSARADESTEERSLRGPQVESKKILGGGAIIEKK
jgi:outer membrane protein assembly factor BamB/tetratricopeptide (TPR) repeat protein